MEEIQKTQDIDGKRIKNEGHVTPTLQPESPKAETRRDKPEDDEPKPLPE